MGACVSWARTTLCFRKGHSVASVAPLDESVYTESFKTLVASYEPLLAFLLYLCLAVSLSDTFFRSCLNSVQSCRLISNMTKSFMTIYPLSMPPDTNT